MWLSLFRQVQSTVAGLAVRAFLNCQPTLSQRHRTPYTELLGSFSLIPPPTARHRAGLIHPSHPQDAMTDIQQWRRMIQPTRARTPAVEHEDSDAVASPTTPKRGLKPKFSSYFSHHGATAHAVKTEPSYTSLNEEFFPSRLPSWPDDQPYPNPNADELMNSVMCRLMSEPYASLEPRFNGMLLQIFECYRDICDEKLQLQARLEDEVNGRKIVVQRLKSTQNQWSEEMQDYKAEVKRLELLLAKGKRGVAEVTLARQDSLLRQKDADRRSRAENDGLETIFEFLEKTKRYEDKAWSSQRGKKSIC